jgi:hypothetical protein
MNDIRILARFISADSLAPFNRMKAVLWDRDPVSNDMLNLVLTNFLQVYFNFLWLITK